MENKLLRFKSKIILIGILILFISCENSTYWREERGLINEHDVEYYIQSIRIDDDSEYHILAVSEIGDIETINDADDNYDIKIKYGNYNKPFLKIHFSDRCCGENNFTREGVPTVFLPIGFKIDTFDD